MEDRVIITALSGNHVDICTYKVVTINGKDHEIEGTRWRCSIFKDEIQKAEEILPQNLYRAVCEAWNVSL